MKRWLLSHNVLSMMSVSAGVDEPRVLGMLGSRDTPQTALRVAAAGRAVVPRVHYHEAAVLSAAHWLVTITRSMAGITLILSSVQCLHLFPFQRCSQHCSQSAYCGLTPV